MIFRRKISSAIKRLAVRSKKSSKRPSALSADRAHSDLITAVDIRPFIAIDFHRNETLINNLRNFRIFVRLAIHHMTPVTPHCANIEQHGFVLALRLGESLFAPLMPLDRLMHGGAKISGGSAGKRIKTLEADMQ